MKDELTYEKLLEIRDAFLKENEKMEKRKKKCKKYYDRESIPVDAVPYYFGTDENGYYIGCYVKRKRKKNDIRSL